MGERGTGAARIFSGVEPTGHLTLGNYLGAMRRWAEEDQYRADALFCVLDLRALTVEHDPARVRRLSRQAATLLLAAGLDPGRCTVFVQSHVDELARLAYLMECTAGVDEIQRMARFREGAARAADGARLSLLTYPALWAADVLAYGTDEVPVGAGRARELELTRELAVRFNERYGRVFVVPRAARAPVAVRVGDLQDPRSRMGEGRGGAAGVIHLLDEPDAVRRKVSRAAGADDGAEVAYDGAARPGVANLLEMLAACRRDGDPGKLAEGYASCGALKRDAAEAVVELLRPVRARHAELAADPGYVDAVLRAGAARARELARPRVDAAYEAVGLLRR
ncbi:tryptophan--tRNA ligase [Streptomyces sp. NRRL F-4489]|uniref:tryptophan--tRNA ligase n=1 Tax=Streptomyces sp. NRRL F-4489 TaxID=1609095 RepID=UPI00074B2FED|nr:tryptophan--tRNA ligase [Streptomyces sp. NRRL F-4489]KUL43997.1 tryptophan--tRNA ligase [Streptomyces sp. NRRL F-4489]